MYDHCKQSMLRHISYGAAVALASDHALIKMWTDSNTGIAGKAMMVCNRRV